MSNTIRAAENPQLVNDLIDKAMTTAPVDEPKITPPSKNVVNLPGGLVLPTGEVLRTAEVRELTGRDEEAISKAPNVGKAIMTLVDRGVVKIGAHPVDDKMLNNLLAGDRDAILIGIFKATFGNTAEIPSYCAGCADIKTATIDVDEDIETKTLADPINDQVFTVQGKSGEIVVRLPNGAVQRELIENAEKTEAELSTILLERTVVSINGSPVLGKNQVQNLSIVDRRKVIDEIDARVPGPKLNSLTIDCPDCGGKVVVPINFGTLFRF